MLWRSEHEGTHTRAHRVGEADPPPGPGLGRGTGQLPRPPIRAPEPGGDVSSPERPLPPFPPWCLHLCGPWDLAACPGALASSLLLIHPEHQLALGPSQEMHPSPDLGPGLREMSCFTAEAGRAAWRLLSGTGSGRQPPAGSLSSWEREWDPPRRQRALGWGMSGGSHGPSLYPRRVSPPASCPVGPVLPGHAL